MVVKRRGIALFALLLACGCRQETTTLFVDCAEANGGRGSERRPYDTIGAALDDAREQTERVTINVAAGTCDAESWPLALDFPVAISGARDPEVDGDGWPTADADADADTVLTFPEDAEPPGSFFEITASGVTISALVIDGRYVLGPDDDPYPPLPGASGITVTGASDFDVHDLRLTNLDFAVLGLASSGRVADSYMGPVNRGCGMHGDPTGHDVVVEDNRIDYRINGITLGGGDSGDEAVPMMTARVEHNDVSTRFRDTGPSTPAALRLAPSGQRPSPLEAAVTATFVRNRVGGPALYAILVFGGFVPRDGLSRRGTLDVTFSENVLDEDAGDPVITFTHAQVPRYPCTLDPSGDPETCPYWEDPGSDYLEDSTFTFHDDGALAAARIDHPANDPIDGGVLGNTLVINDVTIANETFVVVP